MKSQLLLQTKLEDIIFLQDSEYVWTRTTQAIRVIRAILMTHGIRTTQVIRVIRAILMTRGIRTIPVIRMIRKIHATRAFRIRILKIRVTVLFYIGCCECGDCEDCGWKKKAGSVHKKRRVKHMPYPSISKAKQTSFEALHCLTIALLNILSVTVDKEGIQITKKKSGCSPHCAAGRWKLAVVCFNGQPGRRAEADV